MSERVVLWGLLAAALIAAVIVDLKSKRIPDWITGPTALLALGVRFFNHGLGDLETGLISGLVSAAGSAGFFAIWALRGNKMGWGDVKLIFVVGAVFGWPLIAGALAFISLCSFMQALVTLIWKGEFGKTLASMLRFKRKDEKPLYIPFGVAIALGSFWAMWWDRANG